VKLESVGVPIAAACGSVLVHALLWGVGGGVLLGVGAVPHAAGPPPAVTVELEAAMAPPPAKHEVEQPRPVLARAPRTHRRALPPARQADGTPPTRRLEVRPAPQEPVVRSREATAPDRQPARNLATAPMIPEKAPGEGLPEPGVGKVSLRRPETPGQAPDSAPGVPETEAVREEVPAPKGGGLLAGVPGPRGVGGVPGRRSPLTGTLGIPGLVPGGNPGAPDGGGTGPAGNGGAPAGGSGAPTGRGGASAGGEGNAEGGAVKQPEAPGGIEGTLTGRAAPVPLEEKPELTDRPSQLARPRYRRNPAPRYPEAAKRLRQEGVVLLRVAVDARGRVDAVSVAKGSGYQALDEAALEAVRRWEFEPGRRGKQAVASVVTVPVRFRLE
jgi:protein TonB